jgi:hypothetical protein
MTIDALRSFAKDIAEALDRTGRFVQCSKQTTNFGGYVGTVKMTNWAMLPIATDGDPEDIAKYLLDRVDRSLGKSYSLVTAMPLRFGTRADMLASGISGNCVIALKQDESDQITLYMFYGI